MAQTEDRTDGATAHFSLTISGEEIDPDHLTALSGVEPDHVARLGQSIGRRPKARTNAWSVQSSDFAVESIEGEWPGFARRLSFLSEMKSVLPSSAILTLTVGAAHHGYYVHFALPKEMVAFCLDEGIELQIQVGEGSS